MGRLIHHHKLPEDWIDDEEGIHLSGREKVTLFALLGGMFLLIVLVLIGIGF
ncbi:MAG: hypothetical protein ACQKBV_09410 [Puniceicoccales bacterium]